MTKLFLLPLVLSLFVFGSCGSDDSDDSASESKPFVASWEIVSYTENGEPSDDYDITHIKITNETLTTFYDVGEGCTFDIETYTLAGNIATAIDPDAGAYELVVSYDGENLVLTEDDGFDVYIQKYKIVDESELPTGCEDNTYYPTN